MIEKDELCVELVSADEVLSDEVLEEITGGRNWGWEKGGWVGLTSTKPVVADLTLE